MRRAMILTVVIVGAAALALPAEARKDKKKARAKKESVMKEPMKDMPPQQLGVFLDGLHVRDGMPDHQMDVAHFCSKASADVTQCALFDGPQKTAKLIGIEYVITPAALEKLPEEERALWHSHSYEVTSGMLIAPKMAAGKETALMKDLAGTYGKTWHTWQTDESAELPTGRPALMMAFTKDGQVKPEILSARDAKYGVNTKAVASRRAEIKPVELASGVDKGEDGRSCPGTEIKRVRGQGE